jgi:uncharacterized cupredoxin-like copper-binding protein
MRVGSYRSTALALFAAVALSLGACSSSSSTTSSATSDGPTPGSTTAAPTGSGDVGVTEKDFAISLAQTSAPAGTITFNVANNGPSTHEFVVFKTDLPADQLPTDSKGDVDETAPGVKHIDEIENIAAGTSDNTLAVDLKPGAYVLICNLPGHYKLGMHTAFTVQ